MTITFTYDAVRVQRWAEQHAAGVSIRKMAMAEGILPKTISKRLRAIGVRTERICADLSEFTPEQIRRQHHLHVDHDHKTNVNRGLLCTRCNPGIGYFKEDPALLQRAINYLLHFKSLGT